MALKKTAPKAMLVMGPVLFNWAPEDWRDFYYRIADEADVDAVCVGEVVCSKRSPFFEPHLVDVIERLQGANKQVILSTLALIMNKREMESVRALATMNDPGLVIEANDISACALMNGRPFAVGPYINAYNEGTLAYLARLGATSICLPIELNRDRLAALAKDSPVALETLVFGQLPLAISARCYHARAHQLHKDSCQFVCGEDPNGMAVETLSGEPFVSVNGVQTLSHAYANLLSKIAEMRTLGIHRFRLSPHHGMDMVAVAKCFRAVADGTASAEQAGAELETLCGDVDFCNGYFQGDNGCAFQTSA